MSRYTIAERYLYQAGPLPDDEPTNEQVIEAAVAEGLVCSVHPRYQVKRKPRAGCETCWLAWLTKRGLV